MKKISRIGLSIVLAISFLLAAFPFAGAAEAAAPKYVFMFIGDGQGSPQISATQYYLGTLQNPDAVIPTPAQLSFTRFPALGIMTTYDATSFNPDSASTATSMASGHKTLSGVINYDTELANPFPIITEYAKAAGKKVGVISSVSLDHATPAAYYAKAPSRGDYYGIATQAFTTGLVDFIGGGRFVMPTGESGDQTDIYEIAQENGFTIAEGSEAVRALNADSGRVLAMVDDPDNAMAMQYEIDRVRRNAEGADSLPLSEMVAAGIRVLDNENGFFMMAEGGKVDWSGHANDGMTSMYETIAFSDAVQVAVDFAEEHPEETLIIVTGDHETGGLSIGFAATAYDTHFDYLQNQTISFEDFDEIIARHREAQDGFEATLADIERYYGLTATVDRPLTLTAAELEALETAYTLSMVAEENRVIGETETLAYGGYEPLSMAICHILNNKSGIAYTSYAHTGLQIPVYALGVGAENFVGSYDNTDIFHKTMQVMQLR